MAMRPPIGLGGRRPLYVEGASIQRLQHGRAQQAANVSTLRSSFGQWRVWLREQKLQWERDVMADWQHKFACQNRGLRRWRRHVEDRKKRRVRAVVALRWYARRLYIAAFEALVENARLGRIVTFWTHTVPRYWALRSLQRGVRCWCTRRRNARAVIAAFGGVDAPVATSAMLSSAVVDAWHKWRAFVAHREQMELRERERQAAVRAAQLAEEAAADRVRAAAIEAETAAQLRRQVEEEARATKLQQQQQQQQRHAVLMRQLQKVSNWCDNVARVDL